MNCCCFGKLMGIRSHSFESFEMAELYASHHNSPPGLSIPSKSPYGYQALPSSQNVSYCIHIYIYICLLPSRRWGWINRLKYNTSQLRWVSVTTVITSPALPVSAGGGSCAVWLIPQRALLLLRPRAHHWDGYQTTTGRQSDVDDEQGVQGAG